MIEDLIDQHQDFIKMYIEVTSQAETEENNYKAFEISEIIKDIEERIYNMTN